MQATPPLVSVIIPAFNARDTIDVQLKALADQDYSGKFEVIVSDNGSTDGLDHHIANHPLKVAIDLRYVDSSDKKGAAHARNAGAAASNGEFLAFCDADDRVYPNWLTALLSAGRSYDAVGGPVETASLNSPHVASWRPIAPPEKPAETGFLPFALSGNLGIWRHVFETTAGFDESLNAGEDVDFSWRLQLAGFSLVHEPQALIACRLRTTYGDLWRQVFSWGESGPELYRDYRRYGLRPTKPLHLLAFIAVLAIRNPLLPTFITRQSRGRWIYYAAFAAGRVSGSFKHRIYFI